MKRKCLLIPLLFACISVTGCKSKKAKIEMPSITINEAGYWVINGEETNVKAQGEQGKSGKDGEDGKDGKDGADAMSTSDFVEFDVVYGYINSNGDFSSDITFGEDGYYYVGTGSSKYAVDVYFIANDGIYLPAIDYQPTPTQRGFYRYIYHFYKKGCFLVEYERHCQSMVPMRSFYFAFTEEFYSSLTEEEAEKYEYSY